MHLKTSWSGQLEESRGKSESCAVTEYWGKAVQRGEQSNLSIESNEPNSPTDTVEGNQFEDILKYKDRSFQVQN